jgi:ureidoacrylate peracid hydrolase
VNDVATLDARPGPFDIDLGRAAVIVVDMQNDFGADGGFLDTRGIPLSGIQAAVEPMARVIEAARATGVPIVYIKTGFQPDMSDRGPAVLGEHPLQGRSFHEVGKTVEAPDGSSSRVLIRDTWSTDIVDELEPAEEDQIVWKRRFGAFFETELEDVLREQLSVRDLIFIGCTTSVCVETTIREAMFRDFRCLLLEDCCAEPVGSDLDRTNHEASLLLIETIFGWVAPSAVLLEALAPVPAVNLNQ